MGGFAVFALSGMGRNMWFDTLVFRVECTAQEINNVRALATSGFSKFDFDLDNSSETSIVRLGSSYAGLRISTVITNEHQFGVLDRQFIKIEYSAHKWAKGVNGIAGLSLLDSCNYAPLRYALKVCGIRWDMSRIEVRRVDIGSLWRMPMLSYKSFWSEVGRMYYAKRQASIHPTTIYWGTANTRTYEKIYGKFEEQWKHKKDFPPALDQKKYFAHLEGVIRFEVEYRPKFLKDAILNKYFGETEKINLKLFIQYLKTGKLQADFQKREGDKMNQLPQTAKPKSYSEIELMLASYPGLWRFWHRVKKFGQKVVLEEYKAKNQESVYYRHKKALEKMNVPLICVADDELLRIMYNTETVWALERVA